MWSFVVVVVVVVVVEVVVVTCRIPSSSRIDRNACGLFRERQRPASDWPTTARRASVTTAPPELCKAMTSPTSTRPEMLATRSSHH